MRVRLTLFGNETEMGAVVGVMSKTLLCRTFVQRILPIGQLVLCLSPSLGNIYASN